MSFLKRSVIFEKILPTTEMVRVVGDNGMGKKEYNYHCNNCDAFVFIGDEYCKLCSRTFSHIKPGIYMRLGVYIQYN